MHRNPYITCCKSPSFDDVKLQMQTNFFGPTKIIQSIVPHMRERKSGTIVNLSSIGGFCSFPGSSVYCASKFALEGMSTLKSRFSVAKQTFIQDFRRHSKSSFRRSTSPSLSSNLDILEQISSADVKKISNPIPKHTKAHRPASCWTCARKWPESN